MNLQTIPNKQLYIFGAKSLALGASEAIRTLFPDIEICGFAVSSLQNNPKNLNGLPVLQLDAIRDRQTLMFVAVPQDIQDAVAKMLASRGFQNCVCMDWRMEAQLMGEYYRKAEHFFMLMDGVKSEHPAPTEGSDTQRGLYGTDRGSCKVYLTKFYRDKPICDDYKMPDWIEPIQAGAELTDARVCDTLDNIGENISHKNVNYCEITALYWIWKHVLSAEDDKRKYDYCGLYQYRRLLDIDENKLSYITAQGIDAVLPYPTMCEPDMQEHHTRYVKDSDWDAMLQALSEIHPNYYKACADIFHQRFMYNYNILLAKTDVLRDYCAWLFPILARTEELSVPKGSERADRYIGYLGENLLTLYFMYNRDRYKIAHTGRIMLV